MSLQAMLSSRSSFLLPSLSTLSSTILPALSSLTHLKSTSASPSPTPPNLTSQHCLHTSTSSFSPETPPTPPPTPQSTPSPPPPPPGPPTILVFGGRGFVGSSVCKAALNSGLRVVSVSPSGTPPLDKDPWVSQVEWMRGNGLEPETFTHLLPGASAVISCIGAFGTQEQMLRINGTANVNVFEKAAAAGVERAVYISATIPNIPGFSTALRGYVEGKAKAEQALWAAFPQGGVALRPSFIYGTRTVTGTIQVPLQWLGVPVKTALSYVPNRRQLEGIPVLGALFTPPVSVEAVGKAAVHAATDPAIISRVLDVDDIAQYE